MRRPTRLIAALLIALSVIGGACSTAQSAQRATRGKPYPSVPFVVGCGLSHESNDDPIVHPGHSGMSHHHVFFGNRSTDAASTTETLMVSATTCEDPADRASYWLPGLRGGSWTNMRAYYSAGSLAPSSIQTMPFGLQIVAGWKFDAAARGTSVMWSCGLLADQAGWTPVRPSSCRGGTKLSARIDFPQCWDGRSLNAPGNVVRAVGSTCPAGYPVGVPQLRIRVDVIGNPTSLASGGFDTMHADFWNIWDPARLKTLIDTCIRGERTMQHDVRRCGVPGGGPRKP